MKRIIPFITIIAFFYACSNDETRSDKAEVKITNEENNVDKADSIKNEEEGELLPIESEELMIKTALLSAPEEFRDQCKVLGFNKDGELVTLKEGTNEFTCLADNPNKEGFSAACYHNSLEPFMERGRALKAEGKNGKEIFDIREEEVKSGKLKMGETGATLHIYFGNEALYDPNAVSVPGAKYRYVVYMPFATSASTGLPESPIAPNHPWIMNPGTHKAHIMISPLSLK